MPYPRMVFPVLKGAMALKEWQPISAATCVSPMPPSRSRRILRAENTGRSGHPVQKLGGRLATGGPKASGMRGRWAVSAA